MMHRKEFELLLPDAMRRATFLVQKILKRHPDDVQDVIQSSALVALVKMNDFKGRSSFGTWFCRIAINQSLMFLRTHKRPKYRMMLQEGVDSEGTSLLEYFPDHGPSPEEIVYCVELRLMIQQAIESMTPKLKQAMYMALLEYGVAEASRLVHQPENNVKSHRHRARHKILQHLNERGVEVSTGRFNKGEKNEELHGRGVGRVGGLGRGAGTGVVESGCEESIRSVEAGS